MANDSPCPLFSRIAHYQDRASTSPAVRYYERLDTISRCPYGGEATKAFPFVPSMRKVSASVNVHPGGPMNAHSFLCHERSQLRRALLVLAALLACSEAGAQGAMPIRYTSPTLGEKDNSYLNDHSWEFGFGYRWLHADNFYIGHTYSPA